MSFWVKLREESCDEAFCNSRSAGVRRGAAARAGAIRAVRKRGRHLAASAATRLRAAARAGTELRLESRLLGVGYLRILLGAGHLGAAAGRRCLLDARILEAIHGSIIAHSRVSFNGGRGGVYAYPTHRQFVADAVKRYDPTLQQVAHAQAAGENRNNLLAVNHGRPPAGATQRSILAANQQPHFEPLTSQDRDGALRVALHDARPVGSPVTRPQAYQVAARSALQQFANRAHRAQVSRSAPANYMGPGGGQVAAHPSGGHGHGGHSKAGGHSKTGGHRKNGHAGGSPPPATI